MYLVGTVSFDMEITEHLEAELRRVLDEASGGLLEPLRAELDAVARDADARFYTQVDRVTGTTGQIGVETTITDDAVVLSVGSRRTETSERGIPIARVVHRPGPNSKKREIRPADAPLAAGERVVAHKGANVVVSKPNPKASDGRVVLVELVEKPARAALDRLIDDGTIDRAIQRRIDRAGG